MNSTMRNLASLAALAIVFVISTLWNLLLEEVFERVCKALARRMSSTRVGKAVLDLASRLKREAHQRARLVRTAGNALGVVSILVLLVIFVMPKLRPPEPEHGNAGCTQTYGVRPNGGSPATTPDRDPQSITTYGIRPDKGHPAIALDRDPQSITTYGVRPDGVHHHTESANTTGCPPAPQIVARMPSL
jgi:hypothetical protein